MKNFILFFLLFPAVNVYSQSSSITEIIRRMNKANSAVHTAKFTMFGEERLRNGKLMVSERLVKLRLNPKQVYFYSVMPNPGMEVLWKQGWQENKMMISPGSFPYVTFNLKYNSSLARKDSHHSIADMGFEYVIGLINYYVSTHGDKIFDYVRIVDTVQWDNHSCVHISLNFPGFKMVSYTVVPGENVADISRKLHVNDYMILMMNPSVDDFDDVKAGQIINVPNFYAKRIEFFIDQKSWLPVRQFIYDSTGLYEHYEFRSLLINPNLDPGEFLSTYKDYKF
jgi:hypothetical protein